MTATATLQRHADKIRGSSIALIVVALVVASRSLPLGQAMQALRGWIEGLGLWGAAVFTLVYIVATVLFVPGLILTLAAGALYGLLYGTIVVSIASTLGAGAAFLVGRHLARQKISELAAEHPKFDAVDRAIAEGGWKVVALLRLSPAVPFNLQNYMFGLTRIGFWAYFFTSWLAMLPGTFLYVYVGHVTGAAVTGGRDRTPGEWVLLGIGLLATIAVTVYVTILARRKLAEQTEVEEDGEAEEGPPEEGELEREAPASVVPALVWALLAILAVGGAAWLQASPGILSGLFGPGRVEMKEAYEARPGGPSVDHSTYGELLATHVDGAGWVDYKGLMEDEETLDRYLETVAEAPFEALDRNEKLALLINSYNAFTLKLILDHWPVDSIKEIPRDQRWKAERWRIGSHTWSLDQIEHEQIRPKFQEPRIHFVLVCAAVGCPPLAREPYRAETLGRQLEERTEYVHGRETWLRYEPEENLLRLTPLYDWYRSDFLQVADSVSEFVGRYSEPVAETLERGRAPEIEFLDYDWTLNDVKYRRSR
ncbi:MAG: VTT domain-containing protein [Thermoanaerobaculia bacterium]|nr:VTT domain-containing protein [Thermoanaerobaculia bacterium]